MRYATHFEGRAVDHRSAKPAFEVLAGAEHIPCSTVCPVLGKLFVGRVGRDTFLNAWLTAQPGREDQRRVIGHGSRAAQYASHLALRRLELCHDKILDGTLFCHDINRMIAYDPSRHHVTCDPRKRAVTLRERGLDPQIDAPKVFVGRTANQIDDRFAYGEVRTITVGWLDNRMVNVVWTQRGLARHVISMRYCHAKEQKKLLVLFTPEAPG